MGIGISVFLIAVGAILAFAVDVTVSGLDLDTVGVILMIAGGIGLLWSLLFLNGGWGRRGPVVDEYVAAPAARRRVIRDRYM
ncbi:MAG TPA: DUF6458 family protein [Acidimicrobiales bacterium]|nr:DUF6458 family protein [Acidimicrobiales bacterium]